MSLLAPLEIKTRPINVLLKKYNHQDTISDNNKPKQKQIDIIINSADCNSHLSKKELLIEAIGIEIGKNISPIRPHNNNNNNNNNNNINNVSFSNLKFPNPKGASSHLLTYSKSKPIKFPLINEKPQNSFKLSNLLKPSNGISFKMFGNEFIKSRLFESTDSLQEMNYKQHTTSDYNKTFFNTNNSVKNLDKNSEFSKKFSKNFSKKISKNSSTFSTCKLSNITGNNSIISSNVQLNGTKIITYSRNNDDIKLTGTVIDLNKAMTIDKKKMLSIYGYNNKKNNFSKNENFSHFSHFSTENLNFSKNEKKEISTEIIDNHNCNENDNDLHSFQVIDERPLDSERDTINNNFFIQQLQKDSQTQTENQNQKKVALNIIKFKDEITLDKFSTNTISTCKMDLKTRTISRVDSFHKNLIKKFPNAITKNLVNNRIENRNNFNYNYIKHEDSLNSLFTKDKDYSVRLSKTNNILISMLQAKKKKK
jgi:hypothetical protein